MGVLLMLSLLEIVTDQFFRVHYVRQQKTDAGEDVVLIVRPQILQLAEVVQGDGDVAVAGIVKLEMRGGNAVVGGEHLAA